MILIIYHIQFEKYMNHNLNDFINGKIFARKNIITILESNKIDDEIIDIN